MADIKHKVLVSGSIAYDRIMDFPGLFRDHFIPDKLHSINVSFQIDGLIEQFGGTAANIAYTLALLGIKPRIIATVGSDFERYKKRFTDLGIDTSSIREVGDERTSAAYVVTDKADNQIAAFHAGAGAIAYGGAVETEGYELAIIAPGAHADMVLLPEQYKKDGLRYFFDPSQQLPVLTADELKATIDGAEVLFGNDYEYSLIKEKTGWDEKAMLDHVRALVITSSEAGTMVATKNGSQMVPAVKIERVVDPTGAGDAHRAGFIRAFLSEWTLEQSAKLANVTASYCVENYGTQTHTFTMEDVAKRFKATYGEELPKLT